MIVPRACDLCLRALPTELVQFELVRGALTSSTSLQWTILSVPAGTRLTTICRGCSDYLQTGIARLREHHVQAAAAAEAEAQAARAS